MTDGPTNAQRADWANEAMNTFAALTGLDTSGDLEADPSLALADLLADLQHWADAKGVDWEEAVAHGKNHHGYEVDEETDPPIEEAECAIGGNPDDPRHWIYYARLRRRG